MNLGESHKLIFFFTLYGLTTLLFNAYTTGQVADESYYIHVGLAVLKLHRYNFFSDFPPFAVAMGAILPALLGMTDGLAPATLFAARLYHIFLFTFAGYYISHQILKKAGESSGILFAIIYFANPPLKAIATHHLTDVDCGVWAALAACVLWSQDMSKISKGILAFLLLGFSALSKVSAFGFIPIFALVYLTPALPISRWKRLLVILITLYTAWAFTYIFHIDGFGHYRRIFVSQMGHAGGGHYATLWGEMRRFGVWYYFIVVSFFKTPLPLLALTGIALIQFIRQRKWNVEASLFLAPFLLIFTFMSANSVQIGFRYLISGLILFLIFLSLYGSALIHSKKNLLLLAVLLVGTDLNAICRDSYLNYFNLLTPSSSWNFSDSNNDWDQDIPRHLRSLKPASIPPGDYVSFLKDRSRQRATFDVGATELNYLWRHPVGAAFRALKPILSLAGHEYFEVSKVELFQLLYHRRPFNYYGGRSFKVLDTPIPGLSEPPLSCSLPQRPLLEFIDLARIPILGTNPIEEKSLWDQIHALPDGQIKWEGKFNMKFSVNSPYLIILSSNEYFKLGLGSESSSPETEGIGVSRHMDHWFGFTPLQEAQTISIEFQRMFATPTKEIELQLLAFKWACQ